MTGASANWWDGMPLANQPSAPAAAPQGSSNWWDSMPIAEKPTPTNVASTTAGPSPDDMRQDWEKMLNAPVRTTPNVSQKLTSWITGPSAVEQSVAVDKQREDLFQAKTGKTPQSDPVGYAGFALTDPEAVKLGFSNPLVTAFQPGEGLMRSRVGGALPESGLPVDVPQTVNMGPAGSAAAPFTEAGQKRLAGQRILNAATDPEAVRASLSNAPQMVPGSEPTTAALTGDQGIAGWERKIRTENAPAFQQRYAAQTEAQNKAISSVAPEGDPSAVGTFFRTQLQKLEDAADQASTAGQQNVVSQTDVLGGHQSPEAYSAQARADLEQKAAASRAQAGQLWDALKPYANAQVSPEAVTAARDEVIGGMSAQGGDQFSAVEKPLFDAVDGWGNNPVTFGDLRALRSNIGAAQRQIAATEGRESQGFRRLAILKGGVDNALENAISDVGTIEAQQVADGQMASDQTLRARYQNAVDQWQQARGRSGASAAPLAGAGPASDTGTGGAASEAGGGPGVAPGDQGLPPAPFDAQARAQYEAARQATLEHKQTFGQGAPGAILAPGPKGAPYRLANSDVAERVLQNPESIRQYVQAGGDTDLLKNYLVSDLRQRNIIDDSGLVNTSRLNGWLNQRRKVLDQIPGLRDQLDNAQAAQETLDQTIANHTQTIEDFQKSKAASFINGDPVAVVKSVFSSKNPQQDLADLVSKVSGDPDALAGLKKAVADHILQNVRGAGAAGADGFDLAAPRAFRKFVAANRDSLRTLFGGQGLNTLDMIRADMVRNAKPLERLPGQSGTSQDVVPLLQKVASGSFLGKIAANAGEGGLLALGGERLLHGELAQGVGLMATGAGAAIIHAMRQAGMKSVSDLELRAALNPALAKELVQAVPQKITPALGKRLATRITQTIPPIAISGAQPQEGAP